MNENISYYRYGYELGKLGAIDGIHALDGVQQQEALEGYQDAALDTFLNAVKATIKSLPGVDIQRDAMIAIHEALNTFG